MSGAAQSLHHPPELRDQSWVFVPRALIWIPHPGPYVHRYFQVIPLGSVGIYVTTTLQKPGSSEVSLPLHLTLVIFQTPVSEPSIHGDNEGCAGWES